MRKSFQQLIMALFHECCDRKLSPQEKLIRVGANDRLPLHGFGYDDVVNYSAFHS